MDKKLQQIAHLETKVSDLTYEIKTLIQLAEIENQSMPVYSNLPTENSAQGYLPAQDINDDDIPYLTEKMVRNEAQAAIQLKRCIDIAQKITGASHYNNSNSRFKDLTIDNYTLDLRRLFESLRMENASAVVFYSRKENKILFVNNQSRQLLGWSPDKFVQSFNASLAIKNDAYVNLKMKSKAGSQVDVQALLGIIPTGIFRHHILGVLYTQNTTG
jgi:PAS domain-containing protein